MFALLAMEEDRQNKAPTEDMIEAAYKFILKVGKVLQERVDNGKNTINQEKHASIYARFKLMEENKCDFEVSQRF